MSSKDDFKKFVKKNPSLLNFVNSGKMSWQKFYEMYDLYGENDIIWNNYIKSDYKSDIIDWIKNIDIDKLEENINSVRRVLSVLAEVGKDKVDSANSYTPRPLYRHFED
jgi:hypothetical protein